MKIQNQIAKSFQSTFGLKDNWLQKYKEFENRFLKEQNAIILADNGQPYLLQEMNSMV